MSKECLPNDMQSWANLFQILFQEILFLYLQTSLFSECNQVEKLENTYFYHFSIFSTENYRFQCKVCNVIFMNEVISNDNMEQS